MSKYRITAGMILISFCLSNLVVASPPRIAVESYLASVNEITGKETYGQIIVHRDFDVELEDDIHPIPLFSFQYEGLHHAKGATPKNRVEARAKCIAERLTVALQLLRLNKEGLKEGELIVDNDDWNEWRFTAQSMPPIAPAIYISHPSLKDKRLRVMTIYPQDVSLFPRSGNQKDLALYIKALIETHYLLFFEKSVAIEHYENLLMDKTREGKIFKEIFIRTKEAMELKNMDTMDDKVLKDALARISMQQRQRLVNLAYLAPRDFVGLTN